MPKISKRAENMPASPVRKLVPYAIQAKQKGIKVYHLNIGQPDIETPDVVLNTIKNQSLRVLEYALSEGNIEYRTALKNYYHSLGFNDLNEKLPSKGSTRSSVIENEPSLNSGFQFFGLVNSPSYATIV